MARGGSPPGGSGTLRRLSSVSALDLRELLRRPGFSLWLDRLTMCKGWGSADPGSTGQVTEAVFGPERLLEAALGSIVIKRGLETCRVGVVIILYRVSDGVV
jgi:hypothetical protein